MSKFSTSMTNAFAGVAAISMTAFLLVASFSTSSGAIAAAGIVA
ncbi:hypothetical protein [Altericroceibacterium endophyticum]|nr:hypothetical protein [Altericroceibacterium endophyticum]